MQFLNRNLHGRQEVGHIDLMSKFSYIEVPEKDAQKVMKGINGAIYKGREVRCNDADEGGRGGKQATGGRGNSRTAGSRKGTHRDDADDFSRYEKKSKRNKPQEDTGDWRQFFQHNDVKLKGEEPDFAEEGWARRRPKKK